MDVTLRELDYVRVLAEERHFTKAAARLHMAQPAFSQAIRRLERRLGVPLFDRSSRSVTPTAAGSSLAADADSILASAARAVERARRSGSPAATLRVHINETSLICPRRLLSELRRKHPEIAVHQTTVPTHALVSALVSGEIDATLGPPVRHPECTSELFAEESVGVLVGADHVLAGRDRVSVIDLADQPVVRLDEFLASDWNDFVGRLFARVRSRPTWTASTAFGSLAAADLAAESRAALFCLASIDEQTSAGVTWVPLDPPVMTPWYISWRTEDSDHGALPPLIDLARALPS